VIAVAMSAVYLLDAVTGRILISHPLTLAPDAPVALDPHGRQLAYLDAREQLQTLDLQSGATETVKEVATVPTKLAWSSDKQLLIGGKDGSVLAWQPAIGRTWLIPSPFSRTFQASAWPGQPPQGIVLDLAVSHDSTRLAVLRQDTQSVDLHDLADGRLLTALTPPSSTLSIPARISFGPNDDLVTAWAFHAMTRDKPRYIAVHRLPRNFDEALAAARARLTALNTIWSPAGPPH
jgi:WD40 repeat protein